MDWDLAIARADALSTRHKSAADLLFFYRAVVQYLAERWHIEVGGLAEGSGSCPFCSRAPIVSVMNGHRRLICSLCSHEWTFTEKICPGCHADKIEVLRHRSFPHLKAEACTSC